jgi:hypothetical protein
MNKKNFLVLILVVIFVGALVSAINFLVKKYERGSQSQLQPVKDIISSPVSSREAISEPNQDLSQEADNQFSTEKGKFLQ